MKSKIAVTRKKRLYVIIFFILLLALQSIISNAQNPVFQRDLRFYNGLEGSFGTRQFKISSNIAAIDQSHAVQAGGKIGLVWGNDVWRARLGVLGYYSQASNMTGTLDLYENSFLMNVYPLNLILKRATKMSPYIVSGLSNSRIKFSGHYLSAEQGNINYSTCDQPYLGNINLIQASIGTGIDFKLIDDFDFIHAFAEAVYGFSVSEKTTHSEFSKTTLSNQLIFNVGLRFGKHSLKKFKI